MKQYINRFLTFLAVSAAVFGSFKIDVLAAQGDWVEESFVRLIAFPKEFEGKRILVSGFLHIPDRGPAEIYMSKEAYEMYSKDHVLLWSLRESIEGFSDMHHRYVLVRGTYQVSKYNLGGDSLGALEEIDRMYVVPPRNSEPGRNADGSEMGKRNRDGVK